MNKEKNICTLRKVTDADYEKMLEAAKTYEIPKELEAIIKSLADK